MPETHFRISTKIIVTAFLALSCCIVGLVTYIYQQDKADYKEDKKVVLEAIKTQGDGIMATTQVQQHVLREIVRLDGADATHAVNQRAHHEPAKPDGG
ncbi:MAG TPA: hypothetical protein ENH94_11410 [Phycisphaerales bacterium]|nr:hypothetical protein [Phycisphaerales bacterium]